MCAKTIISNIPKWLKTSVAITCSAASIIGSTVWAVASKTETITNAVTGNSEGISRNATGIKHAREALEDLAKAQRTEDKSLRLDQAIDRGKIIEIGVNQRHVLDAILELKELLKENQRIRENNRNK